MSTSAHSVFLLPKGTLNVFCIDGLSAFEIENVKKFYNFGGNVTYNNCGPE